jgi:uncharacterized membrane protein YgdD (TMEM256/DUF423 family)
MFRSFPLGDALALTGLLLAVLSIAPLYMVTGSTSRWATAVRIICGITMIGGVILLILASIGVFGPVTPCTGECIIT